MEGLPICKDLRSVLEKKQNPKKPKFISPEQRFNLSPLTDLISPPALLSQNGPVYFCHLRVALTIGRHR